VKDKILIIVSIVFVIGLAISIFFFIDLTNKNETLDIDNKQLNNDIKDTEDELADSQDEVEDLEENKSVLFGETTKLSSDLEDMVAERDEVSASVDALQNSFDGLGDFTYCSSSYTELDLSSSDYSNIEGLMEEIVTWYEDNVVAVVAYDWLKFWGFDGTPLWLIVETEDDVDFFVIYFKDDYGYTNGVYFIREQCWLDGGS